MLYTIYVDSRYGSDSNTGAIDSPVQTLSYAFSQVYEGGIIVLQNGTGASYGDLTLTKNVTIKAAYGSEPKVGSFTLSGVQGLIEGLFFENLVTGISASNISIGSLIIRECTFRDVQTPINVDSLNYLAIHRNYFYNFISAVRISSAIEVCVSSNIFANGIRSVDVLTVQRLDLWGNTIYGALNASPAVNPDTNLRIIYKTLSAFDIQYKRIQLPGFASQALSGNYDVGFNVVNGPSFNYGSDFTVLLFGSIVSWDGLQLEQEFQVGDVVRVIYSETGDVTTSNAIRAQNVGDQNSRIDSNSISSNGNSIDTGVFISTPVKIQYNNFDDVLVWWAGAIPTGSTGMHNIGETAMYRDPLNEDFKLQPSSPNIDKGDYDRWSSIYGEIGTGTRENVTPFDRDLDFDMFHRGATGILGLTGDIGAYEFNHNETAMGNYVAEFGFDKAYPGTETGPYATLDYGYQRSGINDLFIETNPVPYRIGETGPYGSVSSTSAYGTRYGRYRSKNTRLSDSDLVIGSRSKNDVMMIYPSHPSLETGLSYVSPDGDDSGDGTITTPYRTIGRAIQDGNPYVMVEPGYYPSFRGESGISLIGVERFKTVGYSGILYTNVRDGSWTGIGTYTITKDSITDMIAPADVMGLFSFGTGVDLKIFVSMTSGSLTLKLFNVDNALYVKLNRVLNVNKSGITFGYTTGGVNYEINQMVLQTPEELFTNLRVRIVVNGNKFSMYLDNDYIHTTYSNTLTSGSYISWVPQFTNTGVGTDVISNLSAFSDTLSGATGVSEVVTLKKFFAITGSTGLQE